MESHHVIATLIGVLLVIFLVSMIISIWYSIYITNNPTAQKRTLFIFKKKPKMPHFTPHPHPPHHGVGKPRCPCGGHDPRECKCGH